MAIWSASGGHGGAHDLDRRIGNRGDPAAVHEVAWLSVRELHPRRRVVVELAPGGAESHRHDGDEGRLDRVWLPQVGLREYRPSGFRPTSGFRVFRFRIAAAARSSTPSVSPWPATSWSSIWNPARPGGRPACWSCVPEPPGWAGPPQLSSWPSIKAHPAISKAGESPASC